MRPSEAAYYLYCLTPSGCELQCSAAGVDERQPVLVLACGDACAIYSEVELGEFAGESAEANMQDLAWLGPLVCRHESVIEQVMGRAAVLPALPVARCIATCCGMRRRVRRRAALELSAR